MPHTPTPGGFRRPRVLAALAAVSLLLVAAAYYAAGDGRAGPRAEARRTDEPSAAQPQADLQAGREREARLALEELERVEKTAELSALIEHADRLLREHAGTAAEAAIRDRRTGYLARLDERAVEAARAFAAAHPLDFAGRREQYRAYLERYPTGAFVQEATDALATIADEWDRHDFRQACDRFYARPLDLAAVQAGCRSYLAGHPEGRFRAAASDLLRWCGRAGVAGEYRVVLKSGSFDRSAKAWGSRGPKLSVEIEVAGVRHGPSPIAPRGFDPQWNYEFPRRVRWKPGDPVVIRVTDHWYYRRAVVASYSEDGDPLAMRLLSTTVDVGGHALTFESDFRLPELPEID